MMPPAPFPGRGKTAVRARARRGVAPIPRPPSGVKQPGPIGRAPLQEEDFEAAARALGCEVAAIKAVPQLESGGRGFLADGRPKMLFEAHVFANLTKHRFDQNHRDIATAGWDRSSYAYGEGE